jgi:hypothetical protein
VSHPAAQPARTVQPTEASVPFRVGETLTYDVTLSSYVVAGTAVATVEGKRPLSSRTAYHIVAEGRPLPMLASLYALYYRMETFLDSVTLLPHLVAMYSEEGANKRVGRTSFDRLSRRASLEMEAERTARWEIDVPQQVQDGLSALYVLRAVDWKPGNRIVLPVIDQGNLYTLQAEAVGRELVTVPLGDLDSWNLKISIGNTGGQAAASNIGVWLSTDARRLPVKLQADMPLGRFVLLLRQTS